MPKPKVAFVGSGGATKGVAHLGVLKAMEELGIAPDVFVGASAGAIAGAFASQGVTADDMVDWMRPFWARKDPEGSLKARHFMGLPNREQLARPGYLGSGLFSIDRFERFLARRLPTNDFRRVERPLLVTATDIDGRGRVVFGRGFDDRTPISQAVAASSCVPLLFRPYRIGERYLVDGELVRTLSLDLAVEAGAEVVVISNVYRPHVTKDRDATLAHGGAPAVARQALNIVLSEKERRGIDLLHRLYPHVTLINVSADLGLFSFIDRAGVKGLLTRGYREALRVLLAAKQRGVFDGVVRTKAVGTA